MKSKRLLSALIAAAMIAGTMPVTVFAGRLDYEPEETEVTEVAETEEKETSKPTVKETKPTEKETEPEDKETEPEVKETEKPAEAPDETVPETEAPAETEKPEAEQPKETEAPAETEKPAAEAPKETEKTAEATHKAPAKNATISNAAIATDGTLTWDPVDGACGYNVKINEYTAGFDNSCGTSVEINKEINHDIKSGLIAKPKNNTYTIKISAYTYNTEGVEEIIAESDELTYVYNTSASLVKVGTISGVKTSGKNLVWNSVKGATEYCVYYDGDHVVTTNSYPVGPVIDKEIEDRLIWKSGNDKYGVYILAYDCDGVLLAEFSGEFIYKTSAEPAKLSPLSNVKLSADGILTWDDYAGAAGYCARVVGINNYTWAYRDDETINSIDLKKAILGSVNNGNVEELSSYKIELYAYNSSWDYFAEFELSFKYKEANTLSVKAKKTYKVKASKVKKKNQSIKRSKVMTVKNNKGTLSFTKVSGNAKITINRTSGKITVKKKLKKGTYKVQVAVKASGNATYATITKTVTIKIKVK